MSAFSFLLNVLWIIFGGLWMAVAWFVAAIIMAITIIGLPWTRAAFNIGVYTLLPFGQTAISRAEYSGTEDLGTGLLGFLGQSHLADPCRLVAGVRSPHHCNFACHYVGRNSLRLGAFETRRHSALAYREDHRSDRGCSAWLPSPIGNPAALINLRVQKDDRTHRACARRISLCVFILGPNTDIRSANENCSSVVWFTHLHRS